MIASCCQVTEGERLRNASVCDGVFREGKYCSLLVTKSMHVLARKQIMMIWLVSLRLSLSQGFILMLSEVSLLLHLWFVSVFTFVSVSLSLCPLNLLIFHCFSCDCVL